MALMVINTLLDSSGNKAGIELETNDLRPNFNNVKRAVVKCHGVEELDEIDNGDGTGCVQIIYADGRADQLEHTMIDEIDGDTNITSNEILYNKLKDILRQ